MKLPKVNSNPEPFVSFGEAENVCFVENAPKPATVMLQEQTQKDEVCGVPMGLPRKTN